MGKVKIQFEIIKEILFEEDELKIIKYLQERKIENYDSKSIKKIN